MTGTTDAPALASGASVAVPGGMMPTAGHNIAPVEQARAETRKRFERHHAESEAFGRKSIQHMCEAAKALYEHRQLYEHGEWEAEKRTLPGGRDTIARYQVVGEYLSKEQMSDYRIFGTFEAALHSARLWEAQRHEATKAKEAAAKEAKAEAAAKEAAEATAPVAKERAAARADKAQERADKATAAAVEAKKTVKRREAVLAAVTTPKPAGDLGRHTAAGGGEVEWYTRESEIELARRVMGRIDTDPASCDAAQRTVQAGVYYTVGEDGMERPWHGNVWINPPYRPALIRQFGAKAVEEYKAGRMKQMIWLSAVNKTGEQWCQTLLASAAAVCFWAGRLSFTSSDGKEQPTKYESMFVYFGADPAAFVRGFAPKGVVVFPNHSME